MSGGSYNYLCWKDVNELSECLEELDLMSNRLIELGYADAGRETIELSQIIKQSQKRKEVIRERLEFVWHAIEWMDSHDSTITEVNDAIKIYRKGGNKIIEKEYLE